MILLGVAVAGPWVISTGRKAGVRVRTVLTKGASCTDRKAEAHQVNDTPTLPSTSKTTKTPVSCVGATRTGGGEPRCRHSRLVAKPLVASMGLGNLGMREGPIRGVPLNADGDLVTRGLRYV